MNQRELFFKHIAQTSPVPLALEIVKAEGTFIIDAQGKQYVDLIGGISVCNVGHRHPRVVDAIKQQADKYLHLLVYGELIQGPQIEYAQLLAEQLPSSLNTVYFTNSGAEATEGAMKLAKRATGRTQIIAFEHSYHGSTQGALSILGDEYWRNAYRPLLPDILHLRYNSFDDLDLIGSRTACVVVEPVQAERGVWLPAQEWIEALRAKCSHCGALLVVDEIQTGFGRTGTLWHFQQQGILPDVLLLGKALGGSMPLGAFIADAHLMKTLSENPVLGHITTFGGHPVCCAAGMSAMKVLLEEQLHTQVWQKEALFKELLVHPAIKEIRSKGLLIAVDLGDIQTNQELINRCIQKGVLTDWFLFAPHCMRIAPPLTISLEEIRQSCRIINSAMDAI